MNTAPLSPSAASQKLLAPRELIDGYWSEPEVEAEQQLRNPATGEAVQGMVWSTSVQIDAAIGTAWSRHREHPDGIGTPEQRAVALELAAQLVDERVEAIAVQDALNSGVPINITRLFAGALGGTFRSAAAHIPDLAAENLTDDGRPVWLYRLPLGPAAVLAPWNAPTAVATKKAAYAWAAGCPVLIKPSPWSPNGIGLVVEAMLTAALQAGLPASSIQLIYGGIAAGQQLAGDSRIRALSFTGSRRGGRAVAATAAGDLKALQLELGSNNPAIVLSDANIEQTSAALAAGMSKMNGAWCESPGTVFVPANLREKLIEALTKDLGTLVVGGPLEESTTFGPQSNFDQWSTLNERIARLAASGTRVITVGNSVNQPSAGFWTMPTLAIDPPDELIHDEFFGPLLIIRTCDTASMALSLSSELETGLGGYIFGEDVSEALNIGRRLPVGEVKVNGTSLLDMSPHSAQGFWYGSGVGGHGNRELAMFFTGARIVGRDVDSSL